ncbi:hypothetical protein [Gimesia sp.]|uniref:hypothetical protein n=1 Tax=Gimesia sp. TaxID=2024833 RepID=UPI0032EE23F4
MKHFILLNLILLTACPEPKVVYHPVPLRTQEPSENTFQQQVESTNPWEGGWQPIDIDLAIKILEASPDYRSKVVSHMLSSHEQPVSGIPTTVPEEEPGLTFADIPSLEMIEDSASSVYGLLTPGDYYPGRISFPALPALLQRSMEDNNAFWIEFTKPNQKWWEAEEFINRNVFEEIPVYDPVIKYLGSEQFRIKRVGARWKIMKYEVECHGKYYEVNYDLEKLEVIKVIPLEHFPTEASNLPETKPEPLPAR